MTDWLPPLWVWAVSIALAYIAIHTYLTYQTLREILALLTEDDPDDDYAAVLGDAYTDWEEL